MHEKSFYEKYKEEEETINTELKEKESDIISFKEVNHFVIIPTYHESKELLSKTIDNIALSTIAKEQINIIVACELKENECQLKGNYLIEQYCHKFKSIQATYHPAGLFGEIPGKGSNENWAISKLHEKKSTSKT